MTKRGPRDGDAARSESGRQDDGEILRHVEVGRYRRAMNSSSNGSGAGSLVVLVVLVLIAVLVRRGRMNTANVPLGKGERIRPLAITMLDPVASLVIIGPIFWHLTSTNIAHVAFAIGGAVIGIVIAWARARVMFVRAVRETKSVILRRSSTEYALLGLLIILRLVESSVKHERVGVESLILTSLISLAVIETIARSAFIVRRYLRDQSSAPPREAVSET